ncbi:endonuclease MutS2 [Meiothermus sp.]|uniref:endonuclease MutS2 n=1 Tax=Meiothermus sp. TaxID=1955249 RepID=UPI00307FC750
MHKIVESLDFDRIRRALVERASTFMGQEALASLLPKNSIAEALTLQATVAEALAYPYRLGGISDLRPALASAREGLRLEGLQLREVAGSLESAVALKHELLEIGDYLKALAVRIGEHTFFLRRIRECLDEAGNVRDDATPRLREIRRRVNPLREQIQDRLQHLMDRNPEAIQERFITIRRDRYVVPVKASFQNKISGIILDQSDSGLTVYMEPTSVVPLNNQLASLKLEEDAEVNRVLFELSAILGNDVELDETLQSLTELDIARAAANLAEDWQLARPRLNQDGLYRLKAARHPLITNPISNDLELSQEHRILLITGPNMGGKTAFLKTLGLAVLMAQCGLFVAAERAEIAFPDQLFVDIGDQQSIQESLSTFAAHVLQLKEVLISATPHSLVLIDELGSGTDPEEGAALSQAFVEGLLAKEVRGLITTHLSPLKAFAQDTPGVRNASMRFDLENLRPTYQLVVGAPGRSYALSIAQRLGFPQAEVERAKELLGPEGGRLERLLASLEAERERLRTQSQAAQTQQQEAARLQQELTQQLAELAKHKERLLEEARVAAEQVVQEAQERVRQTRERSKTQGQGQVLQELLLLRNQYQRPEKTAPLKTGFRVGSVVDVPEYGGQGTIVELRSQEAVLQMGAVRLTVPLARLQLKEEPRPPKSAGRVQHKTKIATELNLRGLTVEEALLAVDDYLTEAKATATTPVRLLHGKGTGALRNALRDSLKRDRRVENFHDAVPHEGGHGVTVVHLKV